MSDAPQSMVPRRRLVVLLPLLVFLALAALFLYRLGSGDPSKLPSVLIGRPAPATELPPIAGLVRDGSPVPGIVHRYPDRALLMPTLACAVYCRFCFRREVAGQIGLAAANLSAGVVFLR